jgi:inner membrane protein
MEPSQPSTLIESFTSWIQESITVKLVVIGFLILVLLIPGAWIQSLIHERQQRADEAMQEVFSKWSGSQTLTGPVLVIPFIERQEEETTTGKKLVEYSRKAYFLPNTLDIKSKVDPTILHRGIFDAVVYNAAVDIRSSFNAPSLDLVNSPKGEIIWKEAHYVFGISDLRGISENPSVTAAGRKLEPEPSSNIGVSINRSERDADYSTATSATYTNYSSSGMSINAGWSTAEDFKSDFRMNIKLKGSKKLHFLPAGKTTTVQVSGNWSDPSFDGEFLPTTRQLGENNFSAVWNVLHFNRPFAGEWLDGNQKLSGSDFGVQLLIPADQYQKSIRTAKYGVLIVVLTFIALFLAEIIKKIRIHPFQYILIGAALTIYYSLLLSLSEHLGYNAAYVLATLSTVILISLYAFSFMRSVKLSGMFAFVMTLFYGFIFVIIQEQDYSLLLGSIGLFITIALLMYFSRRINWYNPSTETTKLTEK